MNSNSVVQAVLAVCAAIVAFVADAAFHAHLPIDADVAIPAVVLLVSHVSLGKYLAKAEPKLSDVLAEVKNVEALANSVLGALPQSAAAVKDAETVVADVAKAEPVAEDVIHSAVGPEAG